MDDDEAMLVELRNAVTQVCVALNQCIVSWLPII
jgi:hypothetical protein